MNILSVTDKINRRKRRVEYKRKHKIMRMEFDEKAIRRRASHARRKAQELIDKRNKNKAMKPPVKRDSFIKKIKNKIINAIEQCKTFVKNLKPSI